VILSLQTEHVNKRVSQLSGTMRYAQLVMGPAGCGKVIILPGNTFGKRYN